MLELSKELGLKRGIREPGLYKAGDIYMRDPFLFTDKKRGLYFLFGTNMGICDGAANVDPYFEVYVSRDRKNFEGPFVSFQPEKGFWGVRNYWAPEVHEYKGSYYMFATFKGGIGEDRGTAVLKADLPEGPYYPYSRGHVTLKGHECLDGTLYVEDGQPWIVFCHEWTEMYFGTIKALPLKEDLTEASDIEPVVIVDTERDEIPWIRQMKDPRVCKTGYLTDAPFFHKMKNGTLVMLWSSYSVKGYQGKGSGGYVVAVCESPSGSIKGPWYHRKELLLDENTGHSSLFTSLEGELYLISHGNDTLHGQEYPVMFQVKEGEHLEIIKE